ncbi:MAG TPA: hypothetical protein PLN56_02440 [Methanoregulaceae archaeon]|nr:MAG: hypothetical protein IPI71_07900 [Methanolinea sp.]HON82273.1 hypothetical protein [Methanoregulaceae archaeon]HPD09847.1 hypothetical protein [Methanoregulaceae archaeon]HRT14962.1 hypothetical protein [Methanoregulaceae archaeon]HRU30423.1 hypothetical protein [Methanoregulaceae archaeon]
MIFKDKKNRYVIELPDGWQERRGRFGTLSHHSVFFGLIGDKHYFESADGLSRLTVSAGANIWPSTIIRKAVVCDFLVFNVFLELMETDIKEIEGFCLGGEANTVYYRYKSPHGSGRFISAVRKGREYTIRTSLTGIDDIMRREAEIERVIASFRFI